jgi:hypothetical protein
VAHAHLVAPDGDEASAHLAKFDGPTTTTARERSKDEGVPGPVGAPGVVNAWTADHGPVWEPSDARARQDHSTPAARACAGVNDVRSACSAAWPSTRPVEKAWSRASWNV